MLEKASFAIFVLKNTTSLSESGRFNSFAKGQIDMKSIWMDKTLQNRKETVSQVSE